jgi:hypothetical protein
VRTEVVELLGHETIVYGSIRGQNAAPPPSYHRCPLASTAVARLDACRQPAVGETITLGCAEDVHPSTPVGKAVARPAPPWGRLRDPEDRVRCDKRSGWKRSWSGCPGPAA